MAFRYVLGLVVMFFAASAPAEIYKCVAEDGAVGYSQVPCPETAADTADTPAAAADTAVDCRWASKFANDVARRMRSGLESDAVLKLYGGGDLVSSGTANIINYVYRFRRDNNMAVERIASLAGNLCEAGSLGDVRCESLPYGQDPSSNACDADAVFAPDAANTTTSNAAAPTALDSSDSAIARESCRDHFRDQIDVIDAEMRSGYDSAQGERYRESLRGLTTGMRQC